MHKIVSLHLTHNQSPHGNHVNLQLTLRQLAVQDVELFCTKMHNRKSVNNVLNIELSLKLTWLACVVNSTPTVRSMVSVYCLQNKDGCGLGFSKKKKNHKWKPDVWRQHANAQRGNHTETQSTSPKVSCCKSWSKTCLCTLQATISTELSSLTCGCKPKGEDWWPSWL